MTSLWRWIEGNIRKLDIQESKLTYTELNEKKTMNAKNVKTEKPLNIAC